MTEADHVFGGARHLELVRSLTRGALHAWPSPFDPEMTAVVALRGRKVCVLASGDPFCHGVGTTLARRVPIEEMQVAPAPSAFSLAASRLGWALPSVETISLHGKPLSLLRPLLHKGARIIALTSDADGPSDLAEQLVAWGFGPSRLTVLEALGGPRERIRTDWAESFDVESINPLNVVAIDVDSSSQARPIPLASGLCDDLFEHDGQITKSEIRAVTLSALAPKHGERLWDVGAGSGSIAIEWMLRHPSLAAIAIEARDDRADRIARNATALGVPSLRTVRGTAPSVLSDLPRPDAIFIGGGGSDGGVMQAAIGALSSGGRLVANAVTLEMESVLLDHQARLGGDLLRLSVARASPVGTMQGWRPAMPVTQWRWVKP